MPNLTRRRHPDFSSQYVVRIGYEILEKDGRLMAVEFGRQGVFGRIDVYCIDTNAVYGISKSFNIVVENALKCLQGFGLVKARKKAEAEVERRIPPGMQDKIDYKRSGNSTCYGIVFFRAAFYFLIIFNTHRVCSSPQGVTMSFSSMDVAMLMPPRIVTKRSPGLKRRVNLRIKMSFEKMQQK